MILPELSDSRDGWLAHFKGVNPGVQPGDLRLEEGLLRTGEPVIWIANQIIIDGTLTTGGQPVGLTDRCLHSDLARGQLLFSALQL